MRILLEGRIDSSNAAAAEQRIRQQIGDYQGALVLDAEKLDYLSSAGLRVILRLKKIFTDTKVIQCSTDVYDIFDMTGFTEMMEISKAYRKLSVDGCEVIGEGANGKVYRTDPDTIVKVYKNPDSLQEIHNERELARKAFIMGIPTAIPYDVVQVGDLYGSVFELLDAKSFAQLIREGASVDALARQSVEILKIIHSTMMKEGELPAKKPEAITWATRSAHYLPEEIGNRLVALFEAIPETKNMLHGDFHIKNIMQQNGENLLIDMDTLSMGHPIFELAAIFAAYKGFSCGNEAIRGEFLGITSAQCEELLNATFAYYFEEKSEAEIAAIMQKAAIVSYTRIYRWMIERLGKNEEATQEKIEYCKQYLMENVPKTENLFF